MRSSLSVAILTLACSACAGQSADKRKVDAITPEAAATPAAAFVRMFEASASGDEAAYRRAVLFRPPSAYSEAHVRTMLAAARLYNAVRKHGVTGKRVRDAGFDRSERLLGPEPPSPEQLAVARQAVEKMEWKIEGDSARPANEPDFGRGNSLGDMTVERLRGGWVVVLTDPVDVAGADELAERARAVAANAAAFEAAAAGVESGKLLTIREVNDFITAERDAGAERALAEFMAKPPSGPVVVVTDAETGKPIANAKLSAKYAVGLRLKHLEVTTDERGRARLQAEPAETIHGIYTTAHGYAPEPVKVTTRRGEGGAADEVHIALGKPAVVEVMLELPDDRKAAISVYEGQLREAASPEVREGLDPKKVRLPVKWEDAPPELPKHNPMLRLHLPSATGHKGKEGVVYRVTHARTVAGRELPVYRDAPPADEKSFGVFEIGRNGFSDTVFVIGTLADARAVAASGDHFQWTPNSRVLGPPSKPATRPAKRG